MVSRAAEIDRIIKVSRRTPHPAKLVLDFLGNLCVLPWGKDTASGLAVVQIPSRHLIPIYQVDCSLFSRLHQLMNDAARLVRKQEHAARPYVGIISIQR